LVKKLRWDHFPWFALFFALFPALMLFAGNLGEAALASLWRPLLFSVVLSLAAGAVGFLITRSLMKAGLISLILQLAFFSYGHIFMFWKESRLNDIVLVRHRTLLGLYLLLAGLAFWFVLKKVKPNSRVILLLNIVTFGLTLFQVGEIVIYEIRRIERQKSVPQPVPIASDLAPERRPDIYLIVLDRYTRSDWLQVWLNYDNSAFIAGLEDLGFYVADCSRSNYAYTLQSMTSQLNLDYLENVVEELDPGELQNALENNRVIETLRGLGYQTVFFPSQYPWITLSNVDHRYEPEDLAPLDAFELLFLKTTVLNVPLDFVERRNSQEVAMLSFEERLAKDHVNQVQMVFDYLANPPSYDAPVFVYAHIISPHPPFAFEADGSFNPGYRNDPEAERKTYEYVSQQVLSVLPEIIEHSDPEPIILLQSDHGNGEFSYANLNLSAFYLPGGKDQQIYPHVTSVNSFRLIFSAYFGLDYPLLEDRSYFSDRDNRFDFTPYEDPFEACQPASQ
jgi:hypothetical protein